MLVGVEKRLVVLIEREVVVEIGFGVWPWSLGSELAHVVDNGGVVIVRIVNGLVYVGSACLDGGL